MILIRVIIRTVLFSTLILGSFLVNAQEMLGIVTSNFGGTNSALINPSSLSSSKLYMDVNIATVDFFVENDYVYIHAEDYKFLEFLKKNPQLPEYGSDKYPVDWYDNPNLKNGYIQTRIKGPSFFQLRGRHAYALHTGVRVLSSIKSLPYDIANFGYNSLKFERQHNINYDDYDFYANAIAFMEIGATYSYIVKRFWFDEIAAGITVKGLFGHSGSYIYADNLDYVVLNDSTANIKNLNMQGGFSLPIDYATNEYPDQNGLFRGNGLGIDIGVTYQRKVRSYTKRRLDELCKQKYVDYVYKIGVSLIDLGFVKFSKNAEKHSFDDVSRYWYSIDTLSYYNMNQLTSDLSRVFYGDPNASYRGDAMTMLLPAAFSIQADYHYFRNWYFNATLVQPIVLGKTAVTRPAQLAVIPRYETPVFEAALPISLYEWQYPRIGAAVRYHFLTVGTDNLGGFFGLTDFTGLDIYFSVKINFSQGKCIGGRGFTPCDNFEYGIRHK